MIIYIYFINKIKFVLKLKFIYPDNLFQGLGTALQIFNDFVPNPLYPFIVTKLFFCSSSLANLTKPYPLLNPELSKITFAVLIELYLAANALYKE